MRNREHAGRQSFKIFWAWGSAGFGLLALVLQFQNCAPSGPQDMAYSEEGEVRVVDDWNEKPLVFPDHLIQLHDETRDYVAQGLCPRKGEDSLHWVLLDGAKTLIEGDSQCEMGGFQIALESLDHFNCGKSFLLEVTNEKGDQARTMVSRKCAPIIAQQNFNSKLESEGESCYLELDRSPYSIDPVCYEACYIQERLAFREQVNKDRCGQQVSGL